MFGGAFSATTACLGGLVKKQRFRLTSTQKYRQRNRLKAVDSIIDVLVESGVKLKALDKQRLAPREDQLTPFQKYWVPAKRFRDGFKPIHWVPKWTKSPHPRQWKHDVTHEFNPPIGKDTKWDN